MKHKLTIATRESVLALWQANAVKHSLEKHYPDLHIELLGMTTEGDRSLQQPLYEIGGKALFTKELETALLDHRADIAVHCLKDVPAELPSGLCLSAYLLREDPHDCFIAIDYNTINDLPPGAIVGTSSLRRQSQLLALRSDLVIKPLRGNIDSRLTKLDRGEYHAIILAKAGLSRLGWQYRIKNTLPTDHWIPAVGQGVMVIECREDDQPTQQLLGVLDDITTRICVTAERTFNAALGGSCHTPIGALATCQDNLLTLTGMVGAPDGTTILKATAQGVNHDAIKLGNTLANDLKQQGAIKIINACKGSNK